MKARKEVRFYPNAAAYRQYFRALSDLKSELEGFSLQGTHCLCCQQGGSRGVGFRVYPNPKEPTFLGFLNMISLYESLKM